MTKCTNSDELVIAQGASRDGAGYRWADASLIDHYKNVEVKRNTKFDLEKDKALKDGRWKNDKNPRIRCFN